MLHTRRSQPHIVKTWLVLRSILLIAENTKLSNTPDLRHQQGCECAHVASDNLPTVIGAGLPSLMRRTKGNARLGTKSGGKQASPICFYTLASSLKPNTAMEFGVPGPLTVFSGGTAK